jgi:asparagine synthase (glutamine-hydrolysing)
LGGRAWLVEAGAAKGADSFLLRIDADSSATPMSSSSRICALVFDGMLHNRKDLAALAGIERPADDADLLRWAYERLGLDLVRRLKGVFALVVWDRRTQTVLAVRDPLGVVPLFYVSNGATLLLSTSIETLLREPGISSSPSRLALAAHLLELWPETGETLTEAVWRVPPGHLLRWRDGDRELSRYWDPAEFSAPPLGPEESLDRFEQLLTQAVDRCLELGPAGVFLSGGLDSSTVAAAAAKRSRASDLPAPWALSLVYPHPGLNEERMQRRIAGGLGLPQVLVGFDRAVDSNGLLITSLEKASRCSAPSLSLWRPAYDTLIEEGVRRGCTVILTGEGGDEWLVPRSSYAADRLAKLDLAGLYRVWLSRHRSVPFSATRTLRTVFWDWAARPLFRQVSGAALNAWSPPAVRAYRLRRVLRSLPAWLTPDRDLRRALVELAVDALPDPSPRSLYEQGKRTLVGYARLGLLMEEWFEDGRSRGVRILEPLLDPDLLEFLYAVPPQVLIRGGQTKWLARASLERHLPGLPAHWPNPVYADPFWLFLMAREGPEAWRRLGGITSLAELGVVDPDRFRSAVESAFRGADFSTATQVWAAWTLETWLRGRTSPMIESRPR